MACNTSVAVYCLMYGNDLRSISKCFCINLGLLSLLLLLILFLFLLLLSLMSGSVHKISNKQVAFHVLTFEITKTLFTKIDKYAKGKKGKEEQRW